VFMYCHTLQHTATHCNILDTLRQMTVYTTRYNTLQHATTRYNTLQHAATRCNTLRHAAIRCNTMQHAATYFCNPECVWIHTKWYCCVYGYILTGIVVYGYRLSGIKILYVSTLWLSPHTLSGIVLTFVCYICLSRARALSLSLSLFP